MGSEYAAVALSALTAGVGCLVLWILSGIRDDIREIRTSTAQNGLAIAVHQQALEEAGLLRKS